MMMPTTGRGLVMLAVLVVSQRIMTVLHVFHVCSRLKLIFGCLLWPPSNIARLANVAPSSGTVVAPPWGQVSMRVLTDSE